MRRPLIETALLLWLGIAVSKMAGPYYVYVDLALACTLLITLLRYGSDRIVQQKPHADEVWFQNLSVVFGCLVLLMGSAIYVLDASRIASIERLTGNHTFSGIVTHNSGRGMVLTKAHVASNDEQFTPVGKVYLEYDLTYPEGESVIEAGAYVVCSGYAAPFEPARNPNGFSSRTYNLSRGVGLEVKNAEVLSTGETARSILLGNRAWHLGSSVFDGDAFFWMESKRNWIGGALSRFVGKRLDTYYSKDEANLLRGMILGDTTQIDSRLMNAFRVSGIGHILAVSGLHFGIMYTAANSLVKTLKLPYRTGMLLIFIVLFLFLMMTGVSASALRAFVMIAMHRLSQLLNRRYDLWNALGAVAFCTLALNPYAAWNVGFQLSFWSVFSIGAFQKLRAVSTFIKRAEIIMLPVCIQLGLYVLSASLFNKAYPYALLFNVPVLVLMPLIMVTSVVSVIIPAGGSVAAFISSGMLETLTVFSSLSEKLPLSSVDIRTYAEPRIVGVYAIVAAISLSFVLRKHIRSKGLVMIPIVLVLIMTWPVHTNKIVVDFLDVGQGDAALIRGTDGSAILIDSGPAFTDLYGILLDEGIEYLDAVYISHPDADHISGLFNIAKLVKIERVYHGILSEKAEAFEDLKDKMPNTAFEVLERGDRVKWGRIDIEVLSPSLAMKDHMYNANDMSLVLLMQASEHRILFTGDISKAVEKEISEYSKMQDYDIDVLKVAHHGSKTSTSQLFIDALKPEHAVIQVGKNNFGHPSNLSLNTLSSSGIDYYRNDLQGCIRLEIEKEGLTFIPWLTLKN